MVQNELTESKEHPVAKFARLVDEWFSGNRARITVYLAATTVIVPRLISTASKQTALVAGGSSFQPADLVSVFLNIITAAILCCFAFSAVSPSPSSGDEVDNRNLLSKFLAFMRTALGAVRDVASRFSMYKPDEKKRVAGAIFLSLSAIALLVAQFSLWIRIITWLAFQHNPEYVTYLQSSTFWLGVSLLALGSFLLWSVRHTLSLSDRSVLWSRQTSFLEAPAHSPSPAPRAPELILGPVVDVTTTKIPSSEDRSAQVLSALAEWKPGPQYNEKDYERHLKFFLMTRFPTHDIRTQVRLANGRPDLVIDDNLLIELKARFKKSDTDRAKGQLVGYLESWNPRGPVFLLLCGQVGDSMPEVFSSWATEQRQLGKPLSVVIAGKH